MKKLKLKTETLKTLTTKQLRPVRGAVNAVTYTEPYSFCGLCEPYTYVGCG